MAEHEQGVMGLPRLYMSPLLFLLGLRVDSLCQPSTRETDESGRRLCGPRILPADDTLVMELLFHRRDFWFLFSLFSFLFSLFSFLFFLFLFTIDRQQLKMVFYYMWHNLSDMTDRVGSWMGAEPAIQLWVLQAVLVA